MGILDRLWPSVGADVCAYFRAAPRAVIRSTPRAWLGLSGTPSPDLNYMVILDADDADRLQEFVELARSHDCPVIVFFPSAVADTLAASARALGLQPVGSAPLMLYEPDSTRFEHGANDDAFTVTEVSDATSLAEANAVLSEAFGFPVRMLTRQPIWGLSRVKM